MVAEVYKIENKTVYARYLSKNTIMKNCWSSSGRVTEIHTFGVEICFDRELGKYTCIQNDKSFAKYSDERPREWQEDGSKTQPLRK
jgi:hypothetical protein